MTTCFGKYFRRITLQVIGLSTEDNRMNPLSVKTGLIRKIGAMAFLVSMIGCSSHSDQDGSTTPQLGDLQAELGWLHGECLAIERNLATGDTISVVLPQPLASRTAPEHTFTLFEATIVKDVEDQDDCLPLLPDRKAINTEGQTRFYLVKADQEVDLAIGVHTGKGASLDVNNDGKDDYFGICSSTEGIHFSVWSGIKDSNEPLWVGYYYLGYDLTPDCP